MAEPQQNVPIETIAYTLKDFDHCILDRLLDRLTPISTLTAPAPQERVMGSLAILPNELLLMILDNLSVIDVMRLRRSNRFTMHFIDTESALRSCLQFAPSTVKGMMAIQTSAHITLKQLRNKVFQRGCDGTRLRYLDEACREKDWYPCDQLAQHIYLPTCKRLCIHCMKDEEAYSYEYAAVCCAVEPKDLAMLPSFRTLPVTLTNGLNKFKVEIYERLYDDDSLIDLVWDRPEPDTSQKSWNRIMDRNHLEMDIQKQNPNKPSCTVLSEFPSNLTTRISSAFAPLIDPKTAQVEQGFYCSSCWHCLISDCELYTKESFFDHLKDCRVQPIHEWVSIFGPRLQLDPEG